MPKKRTVGKSTVTPCKHDLLNKILGREAGVLTRLPAVANAFWFDLTAGDGVPASGASHGSQEPNLLADPVHDFRPFSKGCSPGIMLHHAGLLGAKSIRFRLSLNGFEIQSETYVRLLSNLQRELAATGWDRDADSMSMWSKGSVQAHYLCADAREHQPPAEAMLSDSVVFIYNDPNSIADWCLTPEFIQACPRLTTSLSTLGCNANGLKRLPREKREEWFKRTELIAGALQPWHDLCLYSVGNADQWAYLISAPKKWSAGITEDCKKAHQKSGISKSPEIAWLRQDESAFRQLEEKLFLTKRELDDTEDQ